MKLLKYLTALLLVFMPAIAFATTINPLGGFNAWDLHVMGNGSTIASVMESIKMVISPMGGGGTFRVLLLFMAITGFCIMAIQAGFNPGQNLFKMFSYVLVVWVVTLSSTTLKANIHVIDPVSNYSNVVPDVPAIVGIPAAIVSQVGHYLTTTIEQAYSSPSELAFSAGGFDIFGKVQDDLDQYVVTRSELQQSMAAYVADCGVAAIAQNRISANDLMSSTNLMETLGKAQSKVFLTRYWPEAPSSDTPAMAMQSGIIDCTGAYAKISVDMEKHAAQLLAASSAEWTKSGVMIPFEQMTQVYLEAAQGGTTAGGGTYGRPTGMITQKTLINTMGGNFRQAAIQTGNNELLMGMSISQAEQSQKSGWVTSAAIFKNMMGYVYTTLQAFIFAVVPIIVVALMIPGLGKKIFVNYGQILVWLTLWEPMLSIVNYLVSLFRMEGLVKATAGSGGFTMANTWVISEGANNMVIAASFLGTMVPILTWGLVTGAMAFTDFISHGIGSSFAMQAGAQAATGAASLNNMSMNNLSNNKFDSAHKATVGNQSVMAFEKAGSLTMMNDMGGGGATANAVPFGSKGSSSQSSAESAANSQSLTGSEVASTGTNASQDLRKGTSDAKKTAQGLAEHHEQGNTSSITGSTTQSAGTSTGTSTAAKTGESGKIGDSVTMATNLQAGVKLGGGGGGGAGGAAAAGGGSTKSALTSLIPSVTSNVTGQQASANSSEVNASTERGASTSAKADASTSIAASSGSSAGDGKRETLTTDRSHGTDSSSGQALSKTTGLASSTALANQTTTGSTQGTSRGTSMDWGNSVTDDDLRGMEWSQNQGGSSFGEARAEVNALLGGAQDTFKGTTQVLNSAEQALTGSGTNSGGFGLTNAAGTGAAPGGFAFAAATVGASTSIVGAGAAAQAASSNAFMGGNLAGSQSLISNQLGVTSGAPGGPALSFNDDMSMKKAALGVGATAGIVGSVAQNVATGAMLSRGAAAAGPAIAGGLAVGGAFAAGWYAGGQITEFVGEERIGRALTPAFQAFDRYTNNVFH